VSGSDFGFFAGKDELEFFNRNDDHYALWARTSQQISLEILNWNADDYNWIQHSPDEKGMVSYVLHVRGAGSVYTLYDGSKRLNVRSDMNGFLKFAVKTNKNEVHIRISPQ
jgi:hypothetical protein